MEEQEKIVPTETSPKKQKKLEKIEAKLSKKREKAKKIVVLDNFGKNIIRTFVVIAFIAVLLPFGLITLSQKSGEEDVSVTAATEYVQESLKEKPSKLTYAYKNGVYDNSEEFTFTNDKLTSRVSIEGNAKYEMRFPTIKDKDYIKTTYPSLTDEQVTSYINSNTAECLIITYSKVSGKWEFAASSISTANLSTMREKGATYSEIITEIAGFNPLTSTITSATAETDYNLLGLGYTYKNYTVNYGDSKVVFEGDAVTEVYNFSTMVRYTVSVKF